MATNDWEHLPSKTKHGSRPQKGVFWSAEWSQTPQHETLWGWIPPASPPQPHHAPGQTPCDSWRWFHSLTLVPCSHCTVYPESPAWPAHLARSLLSGTLSSRMGVWCCLLSIRRSPSWAEKNKEVQHGQGMSIHQTKLCGKPELMHFLWKDNGTNSTHCNYMEVLSR